MQTIPLKAGGSTPFSFNTTVGGVKVFGSVPYNIAANRYYLKLTDGQGSTVAYTPLIASPDGFDINLALSLRSGSLIYRESTNQFEAT